MKKCLRIIGKVLVVCLVLTVLLVELGAAADVSKETKTAAGTVVKGKEIIGKDVGARQITDVELVKGWNLVAFPVKEGVTFGDLTVIVEGKTVKLRTIPNIMISSYDSVKGRYLQHSINDEISPTRGYFIYTTMSMRIDLSDFIDVESLLEHVILVDEPEDLQDLQPNTYYVLTEDLNFTGYPWHGIRFNYGDYNITIDCNGHEITADYNTDAIDLAITSYYGGLIQPSNIVIKNCKIHHVNHGILTQGYLSGIFYKPIENITVLNTEIYDTAKECVLLQAHTNKFNLFNSTIHGCGWEGIRLEYGTNNTNIIGNYFYDVPLAVYQTGNDDYNVSIKNNTIIGRTGGFTTGIRAYGNPYNSINIINNTVCCCDVDIYYRLWHCPFPGTCEESTIENNVCDRAVTFLSISESCEEGCFDNGYICCGCNAEITEAYIDDEDNLHLTFRFDGECSPEEYEELLADAIVSVYGPIGSDSPINLTLTSDDFELSGNTATLSPLVSMSHYHEGNYIISVYHPLCSSESEGNFESEEIIYPDDDGCVKLENPATYGDNIIRINASGEIDNTTIGLGDYTYYILDDFELCSDEINILEDSDNLFFVVNDSNINIIIPSHIYIQPPLTSTLNFMTIYNKSNVSISHGLINGPNIAFNITDSKKILISETTIENSQIGILMENTYGNTVKNSNIYADDYTIRILSGKLNKIYNNTIGDLISPGFLSIEGGVSIGDGGTTTYSYANSIHNNSITVLPSHSEPIPTAIKISGESFFNTVSHNKFTSIPTPVGYYIAVESNGRSNIIDYNTACESVPSSIGQIISTSTLSDYILDNTCDRYLNLIDDTLIDCPYSCS